MRPKDFSYFSSAPCFWSGLPLSKRFAPNENNRDPSKVWRIADYPSTSRRDLIESLAGMTSTTKRRIAREWLIFLAAIVLGFFVTYGAFYLGRNTEWMNLRIKGEAASPGAPVADQQWITSEKEEHARVIIDSETTPWTWGDRTYVRAWFSKPKNPGDMLNDMWPVACGLVSV
jgi:hypothetical protein